MNDVRGLCERYRDVWARHKDDPGRHNAHVAAPKIGKRQHVVIADTDKEATEVALPAFQAWQDHIGYLGRRHQGSPNAGQPNRIARDRGLVAGSPRIVIEQLAAEIEASTINYDLAVFAFGTLQPEHAMRSLEMFARDVMPALRGATTATQLRSDAARDLTDQAGGIAGRLVARPDDVLVRPNQHEARLVGGPIAFVRIAYDAERHA